MAHRHMYYFDEKVIDLDVLRKEALKVSTDNDPWQPHKPEDVTIHWHSSHDSCQNKKHEEFPAQTKETK